MKLFKALELYVGTMLPLLKGTKKIYLSKRNSAHFSPLQLPIDAIL